MKMMLLNVLYRIARSYFDKDMFDRIQKMVADLMDRDISGDEKRRLVREFAKGEWKDISTIVIDTIIQIALLKLTGTSA